MSGKKFRSKEVFNNFFRDSDDASMKDLIRYSRAPGLTDKEIVYLAYGLANSGGRIELNMEEKYCDIPSTGGPSSLSTLLCPLFLRIMGNKVLKLGVPGRPAGGIDVLAQIPGYNINPNSNIVNEWLNRTSYIHIITSVRLRTFLNAVSC